MLAVYVELLAMSGVDISDLMGRPLSYFDYDKIAKLTEEKQKEFETE